MVPTVLLREYPARRGGQLPQIQLVVTRDHIPFPLHHSSQLGERLGLAFLNHFQLVLEVAVLPPLGTQLTFQLVDKALITPDSSCRALT